MHDTHVQDTQTLQSAGKKSLRVKLHSLTVTTRGATSPFNLCTGG